MFASVDFADYICDTDYCWWCSYWSIILLLQGGKYIVMEILYSACIAMLQYPCMPVLYTVIMAEHVLLA